MLKVAIHSITAPGPQVENLAKEEEGQGPSSRPAPKDDREKEKRIHPIVEVAAKMGELNPAFAPEVKQMIPPPTQLLPPKTEGQTSLKRLSALANVADRSTAEAPKSDDKTIPPNPTDIPVKTNRYTRRTLDASSSLYSAKYAAFGKAELLAELYALGLRKEAAQALSNVLVKAALGTGFGNFLIPGQTPTLRSGTGTRSAGAGGVRTTDHVGTKQPDGTSSIAKSKPLVNTPHVNLLTGSPGTPWRGSGGSAMPPAQGKIAFASAHKKAAALVKLARCGLEREAVLDFLRVSQDKKAALLTLGRIKQASERERGT